LFLLLLLLLLQDSMRVEVPNDPADAGAGCCAVLTPSCISPEIPSLPDLLNSAVDVGDDRDEEQFQQNLHDLPSPAGAAFALKLAAVQVGELAHAFDGTVCRHVHGPVTAAAHVAT
jgi:hypothetical protein